MNSYQNNNQKGIENEFYKQLDDFLAELGFPYEKRKLLKSLIEIKSGTPIDICRKAGLQLTTQVYTYLHELAKIEGIEEIVILRNGRKYYRYNVVNLQKVINGIYSLAIENCLKEKEKLEAKISELENRHSGLIDAWKELFKERTGVSFFLKKAIVPIESAEGVIGVIDYWIENSLEKVYFLIGSGKRMKTDILLRCRASDIKILLSGRETSAKIRNTFNFIKKNLGDRFNFKSCNYSFPRIRLLIADERVLVFKWLEEGEIDWAFQFEGDKEIVEMFSLFFKKLWEEK